VVLAVADKLLNAWIDGNKMEDPSDKWQQPAGE
jgi:hypothetical protein